VFKKSILTIKLKFTSMNKSEVIISVSQRTGISPEDCEKVLDAFEEVFNDELENKKWKGRTFDKVYRVMSYFYNKRNVG